MIVAFTNPGEIDVRLITTLGVNVKEGRSPIGYFGTGLKYAIAVCLRHGCEIEIYSGLDRHKFSVEKDTVRGKEFGFISLHTVRQGTHAEPVHRLGFTTDLGKNWELWMAYRELHCNAKDEGGEGGRAVSSANPASGQTLIIVHGLDFLKTHHERSKWLLSGSPRWSMPGLEIIDKPGQNIFYKGIAVTSMSEPFSYTYNILQECRLTEDRTLDSYSAIFRIRASICQECDDPQFLRSILTAPRGTLEAGFDWDSYYHHSDLFAEVVEEFWIARNAFLNLTAVKAVRERFKKQQHASVKLTKVQEHMLTKAKRFLEAFGHPISQEIIVVETLGSQWIAGQAKDGQILISLSTFGKGTKFLTSTLLEEHLHITLGLADCSRELQDWLFDKVISLGEEIQGEPL